MANFSADEYFLDTGYLLQVLSWGSEYAPRQLLFILGLLNLINRYGGLDRRLLERERLNVPPWLHVRGQPQKLSFQGLIDHNSLPVMKILGEEIWKFQILCKWQDKAMISRFCIGFSILTKGTHFYPKNRNIILPCG